MDGIAVEVYKVQRLPSDACFTKSLENWDNQKFQSTHTRRKFRQNWNVEFGQIVEFLSKIFAYYRLFA
jgi:hypothetical protein